METHLIDAFSSPCRLDRNSMSCGILLHVKENIPSNLHSIEAKPNAGFYIELTLKNDKLLINCSYNTHKNMIGNQLRELGENLDLNSSNYDKFIILGYFNVEMGDPQIKSFCNN